MAGTWFQAHTPLISNTHAASRLRIIVLGYIVRGPMGGMAWHHLQYVLGLADLGHDVYFVEDSGDSPWCCYDPSRHVTDADPTYGLHFAAETFGSVGLGDRWTFYDAHTSRWLGPCSERILRCCAGADLLLNLGGVNRLRPWFLEIPRRVLIDTDPVFTQVKHLADESALEEARRHTSFFTFGENVDRDDCTMPRDGLPWQATRQPIVLDAWPVIPGPVDGPFTTVMQWQSYTDVDYGGIRYGMKSDSFDPYTDLPRKAGPILEMALGSPAAPRPLLLSQGWRLRDPTEPTRDPGAYQRYIQESKAEFTVAKHGYVVSRSGWFSERSAAYLASGRPVVTQETGFSDWLPTGTGVIAFSSPEEALAAIDEVNHRYEYHCQSARSIAREYFDSRKVLARLVNQAIGN